jgi:hypothetical protein
MNKWIRQIHRWLSMAFTATVILCFIVIAQEDPPQWVFYLPLPPLAFLMLSGLYLFALPYTSKWRNARRTVHAK